MRTINEIKRIEIKGLFGFLNYDIELSGKGIDIITGPNGSGKTTILRLVKAVLEKDFDGLARPRYDLFTLYAGCDPYVEEVVQKLRAPKVKAVLQTELKIQVENLPRGLKLRVNDTEVGSLVKRVRPGEEDPITGEWIDQTSKLEIFGEVLKKLESFYVEQDVTVYNLTNETSKVSQHITSTIEDDDIVDITPINMLLRESIGRASQVLLDTLARSSQVLVDSLVTPGSKHKLDGSDLVPLRDWTLPQVYNKYVNLKDQFITVGVKLDTSVLDSYFETVSLETEEGEENIYKTEPVSVAERYARTMIAGYMDAAVHTERIFRFLSRLNEAFSKEKRTSVYFPRNGAPRVRITLSNPKDGELTEVTKGLSSGEHRYIKLFATLLLNNATMLYIIDEPELSLHPEWLDHMIADLEAIRGNSQYIIASHSPYLVAEHLHLHTDLPAREVE
jgi:predicted ATPase